MFCFLWSFLYIKRMWLCLANSACDLLIPYKKEEKMTMRLPQEDFTKAFWNVWSVGAGVWVYWVNLESAVFADSTSSLKFGCALCLRALAPFGHFMFVSILWLSNSLLSPSVLELALRNSRWHCQVSIISKEELLSIVSVTCCECRKENWAGVLRCLEV